MNESLGERSRAQHQEVGPQQAGLGYSPLFVSQWGDLYEPMDIAELMY